MADDRPKLPCGCTRCPECSGAACCYHGNLENYRALEKKLDAARVLADQTVALLGTPCADTECCPPGPRERDLAARWRSLFPEAKP